MPMASKIGPQDLPPAGGYAPIQTKRIKLRSIIGWKTGLGVLAATTIGGWFVVSITERRYKREQIELRSARFALQAPLVAERDRAFLKQIRKNRDEEAELMKDYPGWEVGTYFGEPIYKLVPEDTFVEPQFYEYSAHVSPHGSVAVAQYHRLMI